MANKKTPKEENEIYEAFKASGEPVTTYCKKPGTPAYQTLKKIIDAKEGGSPAQSVKTPAATSKAVSVDDMFADFRASLSSMVAVLEAKETELTTQLEAVEKEKAKVKEALEKLPAL